MGFDESLVLAAFYKFPRPSQDEQRLDFCLTGGDGTEAPKKEKKKRKRGKKIPKALQKLFAELQETNEHAISTQGLTKSFKWDSSNSVVQHDVHELNRILFDAIERSLRNTSSDNLIPNLYGGLQVNKTICTVCNYTSEREQTFQDIGLPLFSLSSVYESLANITAYEDLTKENQYYCEVCDKKVDAKRGMKIRELPDILILCLNRFEFDMRTYNMKKNTNQFSFPLVLDMEPYTENYHLEHGDSDYIPDAKYYSTESKGSEGSPDLVLGEVGKQSEHMYDLFSVVIHVGSSAGHGHYHSFMRDLLGNGKFDPSLKEDELEEFGEWYDFDDSKVEPISTKKLVSQYGGKKECAYMLVYRKQGLSTDVDQTLPQHLQEYMEEYKLEVEEKKFEYLETLQKFKVTFYTPGHYMVENGILVAKPVLVSEESSDGGMFGGMMSDDGDAPYEEPSSNTSRTIEIDQRCTLSELKEQLRLEFGLEVPDKENIRLDAILGSTGKVFVLEPLHGSVDDDNKTIEEIGIKSAMHILIWDGDIIDNQHFDPDEKKIKVTIRNYSENMEEFTVTTTYGTNFSAFRNTLQELTGIPFEEQYICKIEKRVGSEFREESITKNLYQLQVNDGTLLSLEQRDFSCDNFESLAMNHLEELGKRVSLCVKDMIRGNDIDLAEIYVEEFDRSITLFELKAHIIATYFEGFDIDLEDVRINRTYNGKLGSRYTNETLTLSRVSLQDGDCVALDTEGPKISGVEIMFKIGIDGKRDQNISIIAQPMWTALQLRTEACKLLGHDPEFARLYTTDFWGEPKKILDDETKTMQQYKISSGDEIWIKEGKAPMKGHIELNVSIYERVENPNDPDSSFALNVKSPLLHLLNYSKYSIEGKEFMLENLLPPLNSSSNMKLIEVKQQIIETYGLEGIDPERMRVFLKGNLLKRDNSTLKRQGMGASTSITVQFMNEENLKVNPGSTLLYLHPRNTETKSFDLPYEYIWHGAAYEELIHNVSQHTQIPLDILEVSWYDITRDGWTIMFNGSNANESGAIEQYLDNKDQSNGPKLAKRARRKKKYNLRDGTLIAFRPMVDDWKNDKYADTPEEAANRHGKGLSSGSNVKRRGYDVGLTIDVSDSESSEEE
eukprot:TRINITY_DN2085_c0_g1_i1.p1 TRINITY_DN2085_c0_g1~~TRINITY_DN2085_c0_g1_i1.p1  ORF type:complete len:1235 (-),score=336.67 TRINITY_DN2085_c0_g1_i1:1644-5006(-)